MSKYKFENRMHLFNWSKKVIDEKGFLDADVIELLDKATNKIYNFKENNNLKIKAKKLKDPISLWTYEVYDCDVFNHLEKIKKYEEIIKDYKFLFGKKIRFALNNNFNKYQTINKSVINPYDDIYENENIKISKKVYREMELLVGKTGIYKFYNKNKNLIYIGKSHSLGNRILSSSKERNAFYYTYCVTNNKADTNVYEMYLIAKETPPKNSGDVVLDDPTIKLPPLEFKKIKPLFRGVLDE